MKKHLTFLSALVFVTFAALQPAKAQSIIDLGSASNFAVLASSTITNAGNTVVNGDLGLSPGTSVTGFLPGVVNGATHINDATAAQAQTAALSAYNVLTGETTGSTNLTGQDLGARTLNPGVYSFTAVAQLTGTLTLDAGNNPNARFDFVIGSTLTTAANSLVTLTNNAQAANIFWRVGSSATLNATTNFSGNILAHDSITLGAGSMINGRLLALGAAVTLDGNNISVPASAVPEPATTAMLFAAFAAAAVGVRKMRQRRALPAT